MTVFRNRNLFSANYLERRLPETGLWREVDAKAGKVFEVVRAAYQRTQGLKLGPGEEANLEDKFIRPVLKALGFEYDVQPVTQRGPKKKRPDYALFASDKELKAAKKEKGNLKRFFSHALAIGEAKYWDRSLNDTDRKDTLDSRDPTAQLVKYLEDVHHHSDGRVVWGVLTNGKAWRLFYHRASSRSGNFYETDLEEIVRLGDIDAFKYFYIFFAKDAFIQDTQTGKSWLDQHLEGSETYAKEVSEKLKDRIFDKVFEHLAEGFLEFRRVERGLKTEDEDTLIQIFNGCLALLYRLLFILYAESRELLPVQDQHRYYRNSLRKLQRDIVSDLQKIGLEGMSHRAFNYWARLESLCRIIDKGDKALNVPIYNGGLFQSAVPDEDRRPEDEAIGFVRDHKLADPYLAEAIALLTVDEPESIKQGQVQLIDYTSLGVRQLGDIYEGLLEFQIRIAKGEVVEVREKGRSVWKPAHQVRGSKMYRRKRPGEVYIENSRHERRATGSFYTPHYIVEYIVKHTVGPLLEERFEAVRKLLQELPGLEKERIKASAKARPLVTSAIEAKKQELFETLFSPKILDPAMGSGHFLVYAVDFIADRIIAFLAEFPDNPVISRIGQMRQQILDDVKRQGVEIDASKLTEINLIKRMVMKRCIYGIDLNPMAVELAKLSLWLDSFTLGAPLSFLDHHLKCGNSLVGVWVDEVQKSMEQELKHTQRLLFGSQFVGLLSATEMMRTVGELTDATFDEVLRSVSLYKQADEALAPFKAVLDLWTSQHFGNKGSRNFLTKGGDVAHLLRSPERLARDDRKLVAYAQGIKQAKRFLHWELEFPEVYYEKGGKRKEPGFDVVIGNPPYVNANELNKILSEYEKPFWKTRFRSASGAYDLYVLFLEQGINLVRSGGFSALITPNKFLSAPYAMGFREHVSSNAKFVRLLNLSRVHAFEDPSIYPLISVMQNSPPTSEYTITVETPHDQQNPLDVFVSEHSSSTLVKLPEMIWGVLISDRLPLVLKAESVSTQLQECSKVHASSSAAEADAYEDALSDSGTGNCKMFINTGLISRYATLWGIEPLTHKGRVFITPYLRLDHPVVSSEREAQYDKRKIIFAKMALRIEAFLDQHGEYASANTNFAYDSDYDLRYLMALLNSNFIAVLYEGYFGALIMSGGYFQFQAPQLRVLPIRRINFTTPEKERARLLEKGKGLYEQCMAKGDQLCVTGFVEHCLAQKPEQADVVHDLLAFLAEQMIEINKRKQAEVKGFVGWLEQAIKAKVEDLTNKTRIKDYHESSFEDLLEILKANRKKLGVDPGRREFSERLKDEFERSLAKLRPRRDRVIATDRLIDQIVYRLYSLTEEEIKIVEGSS